MNIDAFRSRTVGFVDCQLGSAVSIILLVLALLLQLLVLLDGKQKDDEVVEPRAAGETRGDNKGDDGWVICCIFSRCTNTLLCGGDNKTDDALLIVSTAMNQKNDKINKSENYMFRRAMQRNCCKHCYLIAYVSCRWQCN